MTDMFENHPGLTLLGVLVVIVRLVMGMLSPDMASVFGVAIGGPLTGWLIWAHVKLRREVRQTRQACRAEGWDGDGESGQTASW